MCSETVLKFSRLQIFWQGFLKQLLIKRENADTTHLDASLVIQWTLVVFAMEGRR
jgi:hypothetical protein